MKNFLVAVTLLALTLRCSQATNAEGHKVALTPTVEASKHYAKRIAFRPDVRAHVLTHETAIANASQLQLPSSAFGSMPMSQSELVDPNAADQLLIQGAMHATPYAELGMEGGWYEEAQTDLTNGFFYLSYLGSYYSDAVAAGKALTDALTGDTVTARSTCSLGDQCAQISVSFTDANGTDYNGTMRIIRVGNALFEGGFAIDADDYPLEVGVANQSLETLSRAYLNLFVPPPTPTFTPIVQQPTPPTPVPTISTPTPTSTPTATPIPKTDFSMWVRIEPNNAQPDWDQVKPPLAEVHVGTRVRLSIYVTVRSAPGNAPFASGFTVLNGKHVLFRQSSPDQLGASAAGTYWRKAQITLDKAGAYIFTGRATVNGEAEQSKAHLLVMQKPRPVLPASFSFNQLKLQNTNDQTATHFKPGETVLINAGYSVRNVRGTVPITIIRTYQYLNGTTWKPWAHPIHEQFDTSSGSHSHSVSFIPPSTYAWQRVVVGITIGSRTQTKSVTVHVHR